MELIKKNKRWFGIGACVLIIISMFLPYARISAGSFSQSVTYVQGDGKFLLVAIAVAITLFALKKEKFALIPLGITLGVIIYDLIAGVSKVKELSETYSSYFTVEFSLLIGAYLALIGTIIAIIFAILGFIKDSKPKAEVAQPSVTAPPVQPMSESIDSVQPIQPVTEPAPVAEPVMPVEPVTEPSPVVEPVTPVEPVVESTPVVEPVQSIQPVAEPAPVVEPVMPVEPVAEPTTVTEPVTESVVQPTVAVDIDNEQNSQI